MPILKSFHHIRLEDPEEFCMAEHQTWIVPNEETEEKNRSQQTNKHRPLSIWQKIHRILFKNK